MPKDGVDFIWARMRELEARQGWWNRSKSTDAESLRDSTTTSSSEKPLADVVAQTSKYIREVYEALPPCTAFIVYSGSGDPRELAEMQDLQRRFKQEYKVKKWDQLSVQWTDVEDQKLRKACDKARKGVGFIAVK
jgi:RNA exonuclease 1